MNCLSCALIHPNKKNCLLHGLDKKMPSCFPFADQRGCFLVAGAGGDFSLVLSEAIAPGGFKPMGFLFARGC